MSGSRILQARRNSCNASRVYMLYHASVAYWIEEEILPVRLASASTAQFVLFLLWHGAFLEKRDQGKKIQECELPQARRMK